jgi:hypothetical protein
MSILASIFDTRACTCHFPSCPEVREKRGYEEKREEQGEAG